MSKDLNNVHVGDESPRFGVIDQKPKVEKAGKYGQSQFQFIKQSKTNAVSTPQVRISAQQLAKHNKLESAWISLKGVVYDVTVYMKHHPGGDQLLDGCGKQSQALFNEHHSWVNAKSLLANCVVGTLIP